VTTISFYLRFDRRARASRSRPTRYVAPYGMELPRSHSSSLAVRYYEGVYCSSHFGRVLHAYHSAVGCWGHVATDISYCTDEEFKIACEVFILALCDTPARRYL